MNMTKRVKAWGKPKEGGDSFKKWEILASCEECKKSSPQDSIET